MKKILVLNHLPNPRGLNGTIVFNTSRTETPYNRFRAQVTDDNGQPQNILLFLNAQQVENVAILPEHVEGKEIYVTPEDFQTAIEAPRKSDSETALVFTNFNMEPDSEVLAAKTNMKAQVNISREQNALASREAKRAGFLARLQAGTETSPLRPSQIGRSQDGAISDRGGETGGASPKVKETQTGAGGNS